MAEKMVSLDAAVRDINTSLQALEENVRNIQAKEKKYQAAFVILKEIEAIVKGQGKQNVESGDVQKHSENQDLDSQNPSSTLPEKNTAEIVTSSAHETLETVARNKVRLTKK